MSRLYSLFLYEVLRTFCFYVADAALECGNLKGAWWREVIYTEHAASGGATSHVLRYSCTEEHFMVAVLM